MSVEVPLTRGLVALIDDADLPLVRDIAWRAAPIKRGNGKCYAACTVNRPKKTTVYMHRLIAGLLPGQMVDHINRDTLDNRRENLRPASRSQNAANTDQAVGASGFRGVYFDKGCFRAFIWIKKRPIRLGSFATAIEAARVRDSAALAAYGSFARLNFPTMIEDGGIDSDSVVWATR